MKTLVVGPGAIGCLFAGRLQEAGNAVWLLDHDAARCGRLNEDGIRIDAETGSRVVRIPVTTDAEEPGEADFVLFCVKAHQTRSAVQTVGPALARAGAAVSVQNGLGNVDAIAERIDPARVVGGSTANGAMLVGPGHVRHTGTGRTYLAPLVPAGASMTKRAADLLNGAGLPAIAIADLDSVLWSKLVVNAAINPLSAVANVANGCLVWDPALRARMREAAVEAAAVARASGIHLMYADETAIVDRVCRKTAENVSSMLQDVRRGRETEADAICGAIVRQAQRVHVPVPAQERLLREVLDLAPRCTAEPDP